MKTFSKQAEELKPGDHLQINFETALVKQVDYSPRLVVVHDVAGNTYKYKRSERVRVVRENEYGRRLK